MITYVMNPMRLRNEYSDSLFDKLGSVGRSTDILFVIKILFDAGPIFIHRGSEEVPDGEEVRPLWS